MKLSHQHETSGLTGSLRSTATGEVIHFALPRGVHRVHVQAVLGDRHVDGYLTFSKIATDDPHDDLDMQAVLQVPAGPTGQDLDYVPAKPPLTPGAKYDVDGSPMGGEVVDAGDTTSGDIQDEPLEPVRETVFTEAERAEEAAEEEARKAASDAHAADGEPVTPKPSAFLATPERHVEPWETVQKELDGRREGKAKVKGKKV